MKTRDDFPVGQLCQYRNNRNTSDFAQVVRVTKHMGDEPRLGWCVAVRSTTMCGGAFACSLDELTVIDEVRWLHVIAQEIRTDWARVNYAAEPYLVAMASLECINGPNYGCDSPSEIVQRFLGNASSWRGPVARRIKVELRQLLVNENTRAKKESSDNFHARLKQAREAVNGTS